MITKVLCIGLGGVGVIASYALQEFNEDVEVTAIIRSDYEAVTSKGYNISSIDYGGRKNRKSIDNESIKGFRPHNIVKCIEDAKMKGPFDFIVVSTKVIPGSKHDVWQEINENQDLLLDNRGSSVVLIQNGIGIEAYWEALKHKVTLISGVSYISSVNTNGLVTQYGHDEVKFGLFYKNDGDTKKLEKFIKLYNNDHNSVSLDTNVRFTRWKKLLYNGSFNTVCCLTDSDVGQLFDYENEGIIDHLIRPLMYEIQLVANKDLESNYPQFEEKIADEAIEALISEVKKYDAVDNYQPSMLVDLRNNRPIELDVILGNILNIHYSNSGKGSKQKFMITNLEFLFHSLILVQSKLL